MKVNKEVMYCNLYTLGKLACNIHIHNFTIHCKLPEKENKAKHKLQECVLSKASFTVKLSLSFISQTKQKTAKVQQTDRVRSTDLINCRLC